MNFVYNYYSGIITLFTEYEFSWLDFFQFGKRSEHFLFAHLVKLHRNLIISAAPDDLQDFSFPKLYVADPVANSIIKLPGTGLVSFEIIQAVGLPAPGPKKIL